MSHWWLFVSLLVVRMTFFCCVLSLFISLIVAFAEGSNVPVSSGANVAYRSRENVLYNDNDFIGCREIFEVC